MNYASKILNYLGEGNRFSQVLLVAGAPPVEKGGGEFRIVINVVLSPEDIRETLASFVSHARRPGATDLGSHGLFAFGMPQLGRFKVHYLTQRGSVFVSIQRMTYEIPPLENLLQEPGSMALMESVLNHTEGGIFIFTGGSPDALSRLVYSAIVRVNQSRSKVVYIVEQNLSFQVRHRNSVVIQVEVGTDVPTLVEGIRNALSLAPDIVYARDLKAPEELENLICVAQTGALVLLAMPSTSDHQLEADLKSRIPDEFQSLSRLVRKTIRVTESAGGVLTLQETPSPGVNPR